jgi:PAS domain S-box-containing protein
MMWAFVLYALLKNITKQDLQKAHDELKTKAMDLENELANRKKMEQKIRESELNFRILFETGAEGILVADLKERKFRYANPAICQMLGYTEAELTAMGVNDIHPPESLPHVIEQFELMTRGEKNLATDIPCRRKDGTTGVHIAGKRYNKRRGMQYRFFMDVMLRHTQQKLRTIKSSNHSPQTFVR